ncbi:MAG: sigma-70 family RNA polymerase sigma factor [Opitutales bacterium]|jgi:RNA polymerase sigma-70 factor, ECF subfamily|nr:sigma-70 family RNA polymerase sigma factor [Opitutales bacterium]MDP4882978.1 sigma-70 family RNA polymerase sigma factor [Opitutales bacterium]MDP5080482.1 sigma-70 family RNA polymerase sigma factor [Opitutales bacterium]
MVAEEEFPGIVRETHTGLRFYIRSLGVRSAWVDDIAQDTYLLAHKRLQDLDQASNAIFWLRAIARNLVMNELAKNARRKRLLDENLTSILIEFEDHRPDHTTLGDESYLQSELYKCLQTLTRRARTIVDARYFQDKNSTEIGENLQVSPSSVRKILFKSRKLLYECLKAHKALTIEP